jgi:hypothetical protein
MIVVVAHFMESKEIPYVSMDRKEIPYVSMESKEIP